MVKKTCTACGQEFPATTEFFHVNKNCLHRVASQCKSCKRAYYQHNKSRFRPEGKKLKQKLAATKKWRENNKDHLNAYNRDRRKNNVDHRIKANLRTRMWYAIRNSVKSASTFELVGCSLEELREHLANQFTKGMSWDNYGKWHVDHINPCSNFDLCDPEQQRVCFHYSNLQPLWAIDNHRKGSSNS